MNFRFGDRIRDWMKGGAVTPATVPDDPRAAPDAGPGTAVAQRLAPEGPPPVWPATRMAAAESLWGEGFIQPGGADDVLRLARPLGLSEATTLLLLGSGLGGPPSAIATAFGTWVDGFESDPNLLAFSQARARKPGAPKRARLAAWSPSAPAFKAKSANHALALEPMREASPLLLLPPLTRAVKPAGHLVLIELVATDPADASLTAWRRLERRDIAPPTEQVITKGLAALAVDVRIVEDLSTQHAQVTLAGWQLAAASVAASRRDGAMNRAHLAALVAEAELWMVRLALMREGKLKLLRWHGIKRGS